MLVSLEQIKQLLGIDLDDTSEDEHLTQLILASTVFVEGETHVRFDTPIEKTEYQYGSGRLELFIRGHIDESAPPDGESAGMGATALVASRCVGDVGSEWEDLVESIDFERRQDTLIGATVYGPGWPRNLEFRIIYPDGYWEAPEDIQELILEMVMRQYNNDIAAAEGTAGVTSEKLGDYSYTVDLGATAAISGSVVTDTGWLTINRYMRKLV